MTKPLFLLPLLGLGLAGCSSDLDRPAELNFGIGLGAVELDGEGDFPDDPIIGDGPQFSGRFNVGVEVPVVDVDGNGSGPRLGGRLGVTYAREDVGSRNVAGEPLLEIEDFVDLALYTPQFVATYRQYFGNDADDGAFFLEPGVGIGPAVGVMGFGSDFQFGNSTLGRDIGDTETEVGLGIQPFLRVGYDTGPVILAGEGGVLFTNLNYEDDLGRDPREAYLGFFLGIKLGH